MVCYLLFLFFIYLLKCFRFTATGEQILDSTNAQYAITEDANEDLDLYVSTLNIVPQASDFNVYECMALNRFGDSERTEFKLTKRCMLD
jgi:hypothetical protein